MELLPQDLTIKTIDYLARYAKNPCIAPNPSAFLKEAIKRKDFFPKELQEAIDYRRKGLPQEEYLMSHLLMGLEFGKYEL